MKKSIKKIISAVLVCTVLAGCSSSGKSHEIPLDQSSNCPVSTRRTGTQHQGIKNIRNGFECTQEGSYFLYKQSFAGRWLLYADHGSDTIHKLCGRPDCTHTDSDCNAYFNEATSICYYDGFLYIFNFENTFNIKSGDVIRMNLDGTERTVVYNTAEFIQTNGYSSVLMPVIFNGVFFFNPAKINEDGKTVLDNAYYKLDGSMDEPKTESFFTLFLFADGENFIAPFFGTESNTYTYYLCDPDKGIIEELFQTDAINAYG